MAAHPRVPWDVRRHQARDALSVSNLTRAWGPTHDPGTYEGSTASEGRILVSLGMVKPIFMGIGELRRSFSTVQALAHGLVCGKWAENS